MCNDSLQLQQIRLVRLKKKGLRLDLTALLKARNQVHNLKRRWKIHACLVTFIDRHESPRHDKLQTNSLELWKDEEPRHEMVDTPVPNSITDSPARPDVYTTSREDLRPKIMTSRRRKTRRARRRGTLSWLKTTNSVSNYSFGVVFRVSWSLELRRHPRTTKGGTGDHTRGTQERTRKKNTRPLVPWIFFFLYSSETAHLDTSPPPKYTWWDFSLPYLGQQYRGQDVTNGEKKKTFCVVGSLFQFFSPPLG